MTSLRSLSFLRRVLLLDAVSAAAMGLVLFVLGNALAAPLGLPAGLLRDAGIVLLPFAAFVGFLASRTVPPRALVWAVIAMNAIWVVDSIVLLVSGWVAPNVLGYTFVIGQAAVVALLADLEYLGLRKVATAATA